MRGFVLVQLAQSDSWNNDCHGRGVKQFAEIYVLDGGAMEVDHCVEKDVQSRFSIQVAELHILPPARRRRNLLGRRLRRYNARGNNEHCRREVCGGQALAAR